MIYKKMKVVCYKCGVYQDKDGIYCLNCGLQISKMCDKCGSLVNKKYHYCIKCGNKINKK